MMRKIYVSECLSRSKAFEWDKRFSEGRQSLEDDERVGRANINSNSRVDSKSAIVRYDNRDATLGMIEEALNINKETILQILKEDLATHTNRSATFQGDRTSSK